MIYLSVLGRQPEISLAELSALFDDVKQISPSLATFSSLTPPSIDRLGGSLKLAQKIDGPLIDFLLSLPDGKITIGFSDYSKKATARSTTSEAMKLKKLLVKNGRSVRIVQNKTAVLSTATSHHNRLGSRARAVEIIKFGRDYYLSLGAQNITAYARRDQARPARDAKVGMLPPKLAQILINLCGPLPANSRILDPFCGTGVLLQEACLMGFIPYGTDIDPRMVKYSQKNLEWLMITTGVSAPSTSTRAAEVTAGDATSFRWSPPISAVACETYLGQPMSQPPSEMKLKHEQHICREIISGFLKNLQGQIPKNTPVVLAIPAWLRENGHYARLNLDFLTNLEYNRYKEPGFDDLLYYRDGQIVARNIIILRKK